MIVYREWLVEKTNKDKRWNVQPWSFRGWFLFGVIPLFIIRKGI